MPNNAKCFTCRFRWFARELKTEVAFSGIWAISREKFIAIWDTGATNTCISAKIAEKLNLTPVGYSKIYTAWGERNTEDYYVDIVLPNGVLVQHVRTTKADLSGGDALIWMDIIGLGDFAISKDKNGNMIFSFIIPSQWEIDFVAQVHKENLNEHLTNQELQRKRGHNNRKKKKRR